MGRKKVDKYKCNSCSCEVEKLKYLKKLKDGLFCKKCYAERRAKKRDYLLHDVVGVRRRAELEVEWAKKRDEKRVLRVNKKEIDPSLPQIKGKRRYSPKISQMGLYLSKEEKTFLYWKYRGEGLSSDEANLELKGAVEFLSEFVRKMREKKRSEEEISVKFKEEFAKLCGGFK